MKISDQNSVFSLIVVGLIFLILAAYAIISTPSYVIRNWAEILSSKKNADISYAEILNSPSKNWLTYHGDYGANRYSLLPEINRKNVGLLGLGWAYHLNGASNLRVTPLVYEGVMYVTNVNKVEAIDATTGKKIWSWIDVKPITNEVSVAYHEDKHSESLNRGGALLGDKIFFITGDCVLTALNRANGRVVWQKNYADHTKGYYATLAPLAVKDKIIVGVSIGEDNSANGFIAAFRAEDGKELWRFWTGVTIRLSDGTEMHAPNASTWMTGSYDPELNLIYWGTGGVPVNPKYYNSKLPIEMHYGLSTQSIFAINADTGRREWNFQFTPNDTHHWDAAEIPVLVDMNWRGKQRKLLLQANRNGFFYVLDRVTGEYLLGKPFVKKLNWAKGLDARGRPILASNQEGYNLKDGEKLCPWLRGATNWWSPSFNPETQLFYVTALEQCGYKNRSENGDFYLRAIDPLSGDIKWEYALTGPSNMTAGTLSTAGGLVFAGDDSGHLIALDAKTGEVLWKFFMGRAIFASPMTYFANNRQYVSIAADSDIFTFGL